MNVSILTRSLTRGGAQTQVVTLARGLARRGHNVSIVVFYGGGALTSLANRDGVQIVNLHKSGRYSLLRPLRRLVEHLRKSQVDVVYSFLAMENLFGLTAARVVRKPIVWGVRGAAVNRSQYGLASWVLYELQFRLMPLANAVISNSRAAASEISPEGAKAVHVVPNGIDTERFSPSREARTAWRSAREIPDDTQLIGIVARLDPMKDHSNFLKAGALVLERLQKGLLVIAGGGPRPYEEFLRKSARQLGIADRVIWLGEVADPVNVYRAIDLLVSSSAYGEGFSNVIAEGMACGVAAVATDVGDARIVVGPHGLVVPPRSPDALAEAMIEILNTDNDSSRNARRRWIIDRFGVESMVVHTESILRSVANV